jgi:hypothetical protein
MSNELEVIGQTEFGEKTAEELLEEFLDECPIVSEDVYANFYGGCFPAMMKILPTSVKVFLWMVFNCELNKGRVTIQSLTQQRLLKECGISQVAYFNCLRDLKKNNMIRGCRAIYFINPKFAWRGTHRDRIRFIDQYPFVQNERLARAK